MAQTKIAGLFLDPTVISGLTAITDGASNADYLFVWDAGTSTLKKILPDNLGLAAAAHTIESHTATSATGANLETLTNAGDADALHTHALKASLAAPALTGHATATTQAGTDDSTRIATTAHVKDVKIDDFAAGDDNTDLDSSTSRHGLLLKLGGGTTNFLRADGAWAAAGGQSFTGDTTVTSGNFVVATAGKGIDFSVNTSSYPSGSSVTSGNEILDYYEEGQFIPHVWDSNKTTNSSVTYNNRLGRYTRIGNIVFFTISWNPLSVSALTQTSNAYVGGLPFTCSNTNYGSSTALRHGLALGYIAGLSMPSNTSMIQARMDANRADLDITWTNTGSQAGGIAYAKVQELGGDWIIDITGHYEVA